MVITTLLALRPWQTYEWSLDDRCRTLMIDQFLVSGSRALRCVQGGDRGHPGQLRRPMAALQRGCAGGAARASAQDCGMGAGTRGPRGAPRSAGQLCGVRRPAWVSKICVVVCSSQLQAGSQEVRVALVALHSHAISLRLVGQVDSLRRNIRGSASVPPLLSGTPHFFAMSLPRTQVYGCGRRAQRPTAGGRRSGGRRAHCGRQPFCACGALGAWA